MTSSPTLTWLNAKIVVPYTGIIMSVWSADIIAEGRYLM
jgi:hypothetical protein